MDYSSNFLQHGKQSSFDPIEVLAGASAAVRLSACKLVIFDC